MSSRNEGEVNIFESAATPIDALNLLGEVWHQVAEEKLASVPPELKDLSIELTRVNFGIGNILYGIGQAKPTLASFGYDNLADARAGAGLLKDCPETAAIDILQSNKLIELSGRRDKIWDDLNSLSCDQYITACEEYTEKIEDFYEQYLAYLIRRNLKGVVEFLSSAIYNPDSIEDYKDGFSGYMLQEIGLGTLLNIEEDNLQE